MDKTMQKETKSDNITWQQGSIDLAQRETLLGQKGCVLWLTGLSGSGKSTIASVLEEKLVCLGRLAYILDGDNLRHGLNKDLGFSVDDRIENIRRVGEVAALFAHAGVITITAFISPYKDGRAAARQMVGDAGFLEIFLDTPLAECEKRDPKGLYRKARKGEISDFTGIDAPYESPEKPEISLQTHQMDPIQCADFILDELYKRGIVAKPS